MHLSPFKVFPSSHSYEPFISQSPMLFALHANPFGISLKDLSLNASDKTKGDLYEKQKMKTRRKLKRRPNKIMKLETNPVILL